MIYVVAHKEFTLPVEDDFYSVIYVGEKMGKWAEKNGELSDRKGKDNIALKNPFYCELTALYWIWKNDVKTDPVGLNHYRRYFYVEGQKNVLSGNNVEMYLKERDVILPKPIKLMSTVEQFYARAGGYQKDLLAVRDIIHEFYPEYVLSMNEFLKGHYMSYANMFVLRRTDFELYCEWLFDILFRVENSMDMTGYTTSEARVYGYLGELLLNIYVHGNKLDVKFLDVFNTENVTLRNILSRKAKDVIKTIVYFPTGIPFHRRLKN